MILEDENAAEILSTARAFHYSLNGVDQVMRIVFGDMISFGRSSDQDVCLRVEPTSDKENARQTGRISREHFRLRLDRNAVTIEDLNSQGTQVDGKRLQPGKPEKIADHSRIDVADVLQLTIDPFASVENSSQIGCCLISRLNNLSAERYLWLIDHAKLGSREDSVVQIPAKGNTFHLGLDFGDQSDLPCEAVLSVQGKELFVESRGEDVLHNDSVLAVGESKSVKPGHVLKLSDNTFAFD